MSYLSLINSAMAAVVFAGIVCRFAQTDMTTRPRRWVDHAWILVNAAVGAGAFGVAIGPLYGYTAPPLAELALNVGLALYFGVRWKRVRKGAAT